MNRILRFGLLPIALALAGSLRAEDKAPSTPPPVDQASVQADNKQLTEELAASWKESASLKVQLAAAQADSAKGAAESADLQKQLDTAKAAASKPEAPPADANVADLQDKLATALRSFSVVQDENSQLKASLDKATSDSASLSQQLDAAHSAIASLQVQAAATAQIEPLRTELRQAQDEANRLSSENELLRTHIAIQSPGPGASKPTPSRPGRSPAVGAAPAPAPAAAAAPPPPAPKTYVVVEGDTLTRISRRFYGSAGRWQDILNANRDIMKDERSLAVGSTIKIP